MTTIPFIRLISNFTDQSATRQAALLMENGLRLHVGEINWKKEFPFAPDVEVALANDGDKLWIAFSVKEPHVRVTALQTNEKVCVDSCVEFFVAHPDGRHYFNFEFNAAGNILCSKRLSRTESTRVPAENLDRVERFTSLPRLEALDLRNPEGISWTLVAGIPWKLMGYDEAPSAIRCNIYKCGDLTDTPHFLSLFPIKTESPDFHRPEFFRELAVAKS